MFLGKKGCKIMKEVKKHIQNGEDIRIEVIPKLGEISQGEKVR